MKLLCFIVISAVYSVNITNEVSISGEWNITSPQLNGFHIKKEINRIDAQVDAAEDVTFHLHTRKNRDFYQEIDEYSVIQSNFDASKMTIFTIHGFKQSKDSNFNYGEHNSWLDKLDCNAITVDYPSARLELLPAVQSQPRVAKRIALFIDYLVTNMNVNLYRVIFVGHSLGAHVCGIASRYLNTGKVLAIIAVDAGNPLVTGLNTDGILRKDDALYTECIVTSGGRFGSIRPLCQANFYVNGGLSQLSCINNISGLCSHNLSILFHIEAVRYNNFISYECDNQVFAILGICNKLSKNRMGDIDNIYNNITGIHFTPANFGSPYGMGQIQSYQ